jgi:hypothetical protein
MPVAEEQRNSIFENVFRTSGFFENFRYHEEMAVAVTLAARAWPEKKLIYAIHKLSMSYETEAITPWSTHPHYGQVFEKHSHEFADHVCTSVAINLAFSAIEEMQLQIKSSHANPRWLAGEKFAWNPTVLDDINGRLKKSNINPESTIEWVRRGKRTEANIQIEEKMPSQYADRNSVRDVNINIQDALHACSYMRNFMTAHAFGQNTPLLGAYEVFNAQALARFLILCSLNLWNIWTTDLSRIASTQ